MTYFHIAAIVGVCFVIAGFIRKDKTLKLIGFGLIGIFIFMMGAVLYGLSRMDG